LLLHAAVAIAFARAGVARGQGLAQHVRLGPGLADGTRRSGRDGPARDVELAESRSVDDQVEWLDGDRILYGLPREGTAETDVWMVPAGGTGSPAVYIPYAWSPSVVR
jgi:hypothetical protein